MPALRRKFKFAMVRCDWFIMAQKGKYFARFGALVIFAAMSWRLCAPIGAEPAAQAQALAGLPPLRIVCTTTLIASIAEALGGTNIVVRTIIPYGMCPGHFDLTPGEVNQIKQADLLFYHGFERFLRNLAPPKGAKLVRIGVAGNWMIPRLHKEAVSELMEVLARQRPDLSACLADRGAAYLDAITRADQFWREQMHVCAGVPVVCSQINRDFAEWMGLVVAADFRRDEEMSLKSMHAALAAGRTQSARLVLDNTQSSGKVGQTLAEALQIPLVMLSNFPVPDRRNDAQFYYLAALSNNCQAVIRALTP